MGSSELVDFHLSKHFEIQILPDDNRNGENFLPLGETLRLHCTSLEFNGEYLYLYVAQSADFSMYQQMKKWLKIPFSITVIDYDPKGQPLAFHRYRANLRSVAPYKRSYREDSISEAVYCFYVFDLDLD